MNYLKISIGIFIVLAASRFIPHPPNFTSLIAISFFIPAQFGRKYLPIILITFFITDLFIGIHNTLIFTYGSVLLIGILSKYFNRNISYRFLGALISAVIFFIISNFGVWFIGDLYPYSIEGLMQCYIMAIPFFAQTLVSTIVYMSIFEILYSLSLTLKIINIHSKN
tara:strand:- start:172 stop:672 length:501 start_codon:yes stop_codon:yes gene_type:complete